MSNDMLWLQHFVDERIALSHKETSAAPNTAHGAVVVDRYGHVVSGMAGSGGAAAVQAAMYYLTTAQTITSGSPQVVDYPVAIIDTASRVTDFPGTWSYEADIDSLYAVHAAVMWAPKNWSSGTQTYLQVNLAGSLWQYLDQQFFAQGGSSNRLLDGMCLVDTRFQTLGSCGIDIRVSQNSGGSVNLESGWGQSTHVHIWKIGSL